MSWYRNGTIAINNGAALVTGTGVDFVANAVAGYGIILPDGRIYEVDAIVSATQLTIATPYLGPNVTGGGYQIIPTQGPAVGLAVAIAQLIDDYQAVVLGPGAGKFAAGNNLAPGVAFGTDQDTGLTNPAANVLALVTGAAERLRILANGDVGVGIAAPLARVHAFKDHGVGSPASLYAGLIAAAAYTRNDNNDFVVRLINFGVSGYSSVIHANDGGAATSLAINPFGGNVGIGAVDPLHKLSVAGIISHSAGNSWAFGTPSTRATVVYAATSAINTSDEREKTWRGGMTAQERSAARAIYAELGFYQWNDAIANKGADDARMHFGGRAQRIWAIMSEHELVDPIGSDNRPGDTPYAFLCFDEWDEVPGRAAIPAMPAAPAVLGAEGEVLVEARPATPGLPAVPPTPAGSRFGVRPSQLNSFLIASLALDAADDRERMTAIETRIAALEAA